MFRMSRYELLEKARFFFDRKILTHIELETGVYYNGLILELSDDLVVIHDRVLGKIEILFYEIEKLERYRGNKG